MIIKKKLHLLKWEEVIKPKSAWRIGALNLKIRHCQQNDGRFGEEKGALWRISASKYDEDKVWVAKIVSRHRGQIFRLGS